MDAPAETEVCAVAGPRMTGTASPPVVDALLGAGVALAIALIVATDQGGERAPDLVAYLFAAGFGGLVLLRRALPRTVLMLTVLGLFAYYVRDYPPIGVAVPVVAALFCAADAGLLRWSVGAGAVVFTVSMAFRVRDEPLGLLLGYESVSNLTLIAAAIALGYSVRARRTSTAQQDVIARLGALQASREAELRVQGERERISREVHDTVGHTLAVISLHAGVAAEALGRDDRLARDALDQVRATSGRSLGDLRSMVRLLRSKDGGGAAEGDGRSVVSLSAVDDLAGAARGTGLVVTSSIDVGVAELSPPVDAAAYRVVQESITNVVRHARATSVHVTAEVRGGELRLRISDDGRGVPPVDAGAVDGAGAGHGLAGMTERVRLLGGSLRTGSVAGTGFAVEARIPARLDL